MSKKDLNYKICTNCIMDTSDPNITFDENGECDYCQNYKNTILPEWNFGQGHEKELETISQEIRENG